MSWMRGVGERLREALGRKRFEEEMDEEIRYHIEREVERLMASGLDGATARRQAERTFGEVGRVKEEARAGSGIPWIETATRDARHALRGLRRSPAFALSSVLTLGLGIGATTAVLSVVDGVLLEPLPYPDPDRLVRLVEQNSPENRWNLSMVDFLAVQELPDVFESVAAIGAVGTSAALTGRGRPEQITLRRASAAWFEVLGVQPVEGRAFLAGEDSPGAEPVVVLGHAFRDRLFGPGAPVLGASLVLDGVPHTVVGVLGEDAPALAGWSADVWAALPLVTPTRRGPFFYHGVGRLREGVTAENARAALDALSRRIYPLWVDTGFRDEQARITPYPLKEVMLGDVGRGLWLLLAAVSGVLLVAVANVGNLFLVRAAGRARELGLRASLGASRGRLAAQLFTESLLVALLGGAAGVLVARAGLGALVRWGPPLPRIAEVGLDGSVLLVMGGVALGSALLFGMAPLAGHLPRPLPRSLSWRGKGRAGSARGPGGSDGGWAGLRAALVAAEFAVAFTLATGAALLLGSFLALQRVDPGYDADNVVAMRIALPGQRYPGYPEMQAFWREALRAVGEVPGVESVGLGSSLPPAGSAGTNNFDLVDRPVAQGESEPASLWSFVSPGFLETLGVPLLRGRTFEERDLETETPVVLVSESWVRRFHAEGEVLGARLYSGGDRSQAMTVVGVVGDVKYLGLDATDDAAVYEPHWQLPLGTASLLVRGPASPEELVERVRTALASLDPELPLFQVETMAERLSVSLARPRYWTTLLGLFAGAGLLLACVGVHGVLAHWVRAQRKELAIRVSLGASPTSVRKLVVARGMGLALLGIALGLLASLALGRWLDALVFGVSPQDPRVLAAVALGLAGVAWLACALPAQSAARIDPMVALKGD